MGQLSSEGINPWVIKRILSFLNKAKEPSDISEHVLDSPDGINPGTGNGIGETVAQRIITHRNKLRGRTFREFSQLNGIDGFGQDKLTDLVYTFRHSAADQFVQDMFNGILYDNWELEHYTKHFEDREAFRSIVRDKDRLRQEVGKMLIEVAEKRFGRSPLASLASELLNDTYTDQYEGEDSGRFAWALWFYRFDADNWFSFDRVMQGVQKYLGEYSWTEDGISFTLFKGFKGGRIWGSSVTDLPVTVTPAEQSISIWRAQLND